jgi:predicted DNA-binding transcriptional regulator YafY
VSDDVDEIAVERLVSGEWAYHTTAERRESVRMLTEQGLSARAISERIGVTRRQVHRDRAFLRGTP